METMKWGKESFKAQQSKMVERDLARGVCEACMKKYFSEKLEKFEASVIAKKEWWGGKAAWESMFDALSHMRSQGCPILGTMGELFCRVALESPVMDEAPGIKLFVLERLCQLNQEGPHIQQAADLRKWWEDCQASVNLAYILCTKDLDYSRLHLPHRLAIDESTIDESWHTRHSEKFYLEVRDYEVKMQILAMKFEQRNVSPVGLFPTVGIFQKSMCTLMNEHTNIDLWLDIDLDLVQRGWSQLKKELCLLAREDSEVVVVDLNNSLVDIIIQRSEIDDAQISTEDESSESVPEANDIDRNAVAIEGRRRRRQAYHQRRHERRAEARRMRRENANA